MLLDRRTLDGIASGEIDLAFRRWKRPSVRSGGTLRSPAGVIAIDSVERTRVRDIDASDAKRAGFSSHRKLLASLRPEGRLYRVELHLAGPDPRAELRQRTELGPAEREVISARLGRLEGARAGGPWTTEALRLIERRPDVSARELAIEFGWDKARFKRRIRQLKDLGLTESMAVGYRLSPRGRAYLAGVGLTRDH